VAGDGVTITGTGASDNPFVIDISGGGSASTHFYYPEDYGAQAYPFDSGAALQDCYDAAHDAGGGTVVIWRQYGFTGNLTVRGGVNTLQLSIPQLEIPGQEELGLTALDATAKVLYGIGSVGASTDDNPGVVYNLSVDGDGIGGVGGSGNGLFVCNAANSTLFNLQVRNSAAHGLVLGPSQNLVFYNVQSGGHSVGTACQLKTLVAGQQGAGGNKFYGGHIGDSLLPLEVTSTGPTDFSMPHDNIFDGVLFETGRTAGLPIDCSIKLLSGETQFRACVFTIGAFGGTAGVINENCNILMDNAVYNTAYSTTGTFDSCYFGAGAGTTKATHNVRIKQSGAFNEIRLYGRNQVANAQYFSCTDGGDLTGSIEGTLNFVTAYTGTFTAINGGANTGWLAKRLTPIRFETPALSVGVNPGAPIQVRTVGDDANAVQIEPNGTIRWTKRTAPSAGTTNSAIIPGTTGLAITGENAIRVAGFTTVGRPSAASYTQTPIYDTTLKMPLWSDGTSWYSSLDSNVLGHSERSVNNTQSIPNGGSATVILWQTSVISERGGVSYNSGTGAFTVTNPGRYAVSAYMGFPSGATGRRQFILRKNTATQTATITPAPATGAWLAPLSKIMTCVAGDVIDFTTFQDSGGALTISQGSVTVTNLGP
jgi:hypothetical protein